MIRATTAGRASPVFIATILGGSRGAWPRSYSLRVPHVDFAFEPRLPVSEKRRCQYHSSMH